MIGPFAVTPGDPAGIGAEIAIAAWHRRREDIPPFFLIDAPARLAASSPGLPVAVIDGPEKATARFGDALPVLAHGFPAPVRPGYAEPANAPATVDAIDRAVALARARVVAGIVTNPINKKVLYDGAGFRWPGHTEYLAHLAGVSRTVMMLVAPELRVVPVTIHIPLARVPEMLTIELIVETATIVHRALREDFGLATPRIAVAGLNPHAGEGGAMGREEIDVIVPALDRLRELGIETTGPMPADTMFHAEARQDYDVALAMYHDQALVPLKALDFARGVNVTLGLPFIRTSPDHGTAFDIAGTGRADPSSFIEALRLAGKMARTQAGT